MTRRAYTLLETVIALTAIGVLAAAVISIAGAVADRAGSFTTTAELTDLAEHGQVQANRSRAPRLQVQHFDVDRVEVVSGEAQPGQISLALVDAGLQAVLATPLQEGCMVTVQPRRGTLTSQIRTDLPVCDAQLVADQIEGT